MKTDIPEGGYFRFKYQGNYDYGRVLKGRHEYELLTASSVPVGVTVHDAVWKGETLVSRKTHIHTERFIERDSR